MTTLPRHSLRHRLPFRVAIGCTQERDLRLHLAALRLPDVAISLPFCSFKGNAEVKESRLGRGLHEEFHDLVADAIEGFLADYR